MKDIKLRLIYVDDEKNALVNYRYDTKDRGDIESQEFFTDPFAALNYVKEHEVDVAFLDITMPGLDGIQLGKRMKMVNPSIELVYITGYESRALDAYKVGGRAYLSKLYTQEELEEVFTLLKRLIPKEYEDKRMEMVKKVPIMYVKTFGNFDMIVNKKPIVFKSTKAKELLAFLVDRRGGSVTGTQIFYKLWEGKEYNNNTSTYVRRTVRALKDQLEELGLEKVLMSHRNALSIDITQITCDYYEVMEGKEEYIHEYNGYYMSQYTWAEETIGIIESKIKSIKQSGK